MTEPDHYPDKRVAEFKLLAETARRMADNADTETARAEYLKIAEDWFKLATEIESSKS
ncbi:MAG TPA: hypothetical protein VK479_02415 [Micropepsaceae bacterium]|nr:hypothetical protein [Micropepsaceae bacterium]